MLFAGSSTKFSQNILAVNHVKQAISDAGHQLTLDLDEQTTIESVGDAGNDKEDWHILAQREINAAQDCDVAIFDVTDKASFGVGYMAAIVLGANKPTLFLTREGSLEGSFISGLEHVKITRSIYTPSTLANIVIRFLGEIRC